MVCEVNLNKAAKKTGILAREAKQGTQSTSKSSQIAPSYFSESYFYPYIFHLRNMVRLRNQSVL